MEDLPSIPSSDRIFLVPWSHLEDGGIVFVHKEIVIIKVNQLNILPNLYLDRKKKKLASFDFPSVKSAILLAISDSL